MGHTRSNIDGGPCVDKQYARTSSNSNVWTRLVADTSLPLCVPFFPSFPFLHITSLDSLLLIPFFFLHIPSFTVLSSFTYLSFTFFPFILSVRPSFLPSPPYLPFCLPPALHASVPSSAPSLPSPSSTQKGGSSKKKSTKSWKGKSGKVGTGKKKKARHYCHQHHCHHHHDHWGALVPPPSCSRCGCEAYKWPHRRPAEISQFDTCCSCMLW